jgi:hypothetical protein
MATSFNGSLGQTNNYSSITDLITKWPTAAQNQGIELSGIAFDGVVTNYTNPSVIANLTLATNENPKSGLSYGAPAGIGVPASYSGWFTDATKTRAEINHDPNTTNPTPSQVLKVKWADNQEITSATIALGALLPKTSLGDGDQGNEAGVLKLFKDGTQVSATNFTITRLNPPATPKPIVVYPSGVTFIGDRTDGNFTFQIVGDTLTGQTFDELQFSATAYDSPTAAYLASSFKDDSSDYLLRNIQYQGINVPPTPTPTPTPTSPSLFQFAQPNYTVAEGGVVTINVTRTGGTAAASINYATLDGSASSAGTAADYTGATGVLNFAAGQTTANFTVTALTDSIVESPETVNLVLFGGNVSNTSLLTINDVPPSGTTVTPTPTSPSLFEFQQPNYTVPEGGVATINVTRTGGTGAASINYATLDGSASSAGSAPDYSTATGVLNFAAGQTTASFTVTALSDMILESPETVNLVLLGGNVGSNPSILTILDVPPTGTTVTPTPTPTSPSLFEFQQPNYTVPEGGVATINVTRTGGTGAASINYATLDGSASSAGTAADYTGAAGVLNFAAGQTTANFTVTALTDSILESPETVNLVLFGGNVSNPSLLTINDVPPSGTTVTPTPTSPSLFEFQQPNYTVPEGGVATINVTRTGGTGAASINYATVDGSASSAGTAADYTGAAGALNFAAGQTTASFTVTALSDLILESPETVTLVLSGGNVGSNPSILTILDVPPTGTTVTPTPTPTSPSLFEFQQPNYTVPEGGVATINVTRTGGTGAASINYATLDGSASSAGSAPDYTGAAGTLSFAAGQTTASFTVTALTDSILESPETVNLVLSGGNIGSNPSILTILDVPPTGTTVTPTPTPTPTPGTTVAPTTVPTYFFSAATYNVNEGNTAGITINRSGNLSQPSAILFRTGDGSAQSTGSQPDYASVTQGVFFAAGQTSAQVSVQTLFDPLTESAETVNLFLSGGSLASPSLAVLSIIDPTFVAPTFFSYGSSPGTIQDGLSGTFTINRTGGNTSVSASVDYLIAPPGPGQPLNTIDYSISPVGGFTGGTVNFNPGQTSVSLTITNLPGSSGFTMPGNVGLGFAPTTNAGNPGSTTITLL